MTTVQIISPGSIASKFIVVYEIEKKMLAGECLPQVVALRQLPAHAVPGIERLPDKQETNNQSKESNTLDKGGGDNHRRTDIAGGFRLTGRSFHGRSGQTSNTEPGANGYESGSNSC